MRIILIVALVLLLSIPAAAQTATPTPAPTITPINLEIDGANELLGEGDSLLGDAPSDLTVDASGASIIPSSNGSEVFGYAKWFFSAASTQEMFGPIAPIADRAALYVTMTVAMGGVYLIIYAAIFIITFGVWLFRLILQIINTISNVIEAANPL